MHLIRILIWILACGFLLTSCARKTNVKPQFYNNARVRRCLDFEKRNLLLQSQTCWSKLLKRLITDPGYKQRANLTDSDISKIRKMANAKDQNSQQLQDELDACLKLPIDRRKQRIDCFKGYLKRHENKLSRSEKFEIENTISTIIQADELASGRVEATLQHAGKLIGARLSQEEDGIRIDTVTADPLKQAGAGEQGLIVAMGNIPVSDLEPMERVALLESCEEKPVELLIRYGGLHEITFTKLELRCGPPVHGRQLTKIALAHKTCSTDNSPEIRLGLSWCYLAQEGALQIEEVCAGSPAASAGIYPGQLFTNINGTSLLGKSNLQIRELLVSFPDRPLFLGQRKDSLLSPDALRGTPLSPEHANACWQAIESARHASTASELP